MGTNKKHINITLILAIIGFNLILRYPKYDFTQGTDSFENNILTQLIIHQGVDNRFVSFLSYFGLYYGSDALGPLFLLSSISLMTGKSIELSILFLCQWFSILSSLGCFILVKNFSRNKLTLLFSLLIYTSSPAIIVYTNWSYSSRGLFLCILPIWIHILLTLKNKYSNNSFIIFLLLAFSMISSHKMSLYAFYIVIPLLLSVLIYRYKKVFNNHRDYVVLGLLFATFLIIILSFTQYNINSSISESFQEVEASGETKINAIFKIMTNLFFHYSLYLGIPIIFAPLGLISISKTFWKNSNSIFLLLILFFVSPIWMDITYFALFSLHIIVIFSLIGIEYILNIIKEKNNIQKSSLSFISITLIIMLILTPSFVTVGTHWTAYGIDKQEQIRYARDAGAHYRVMDEGSPIIANTFTSETKMYSYGNVEDATPYGKLGPYYSENYINMNIDIVEILSTEARSLYEYKVGEVPHSITYSLFLSNTTYKDHSIQAPLLFVYGDYPSFIFLTADVHIDYVVYEQKYYESTFLESINKNMYCTYSNDEYRMVFFNTI